MNSIKNVEKIKFDQNLRGLAVLESKELRFKFSLHLPFFPLKVGQTCKLCTSLQKIKNVTFKSCFAVDIFKLK